MADRDTLAILAEEIAFSFEPLMAALASPEAYRDFLEELGWDFDVVPPALDELRDPVEAISDFISEGEVEDDAVAALLDAENVAFEEISNLKNVASLPADFRNEFPRQLVDFLIVEHLLEQHPRLGYLLLLLGLIRTEDVPAQGGRPAYVRRVLLVEDLGDFLSNPLDYLKASYRWGQSDFDGTRMVLGLEGFLNAWGLNVHSQLLDTPTLTRLKAGALSLDGFFDSALRLALIESQSDPEFSAGVGLFLLPETADDKPGFSFLPFAAAGFDEAIEIAENLTLQFKAQADLAGGIGLLVRPNKDVEGVAGLGSGAPAALSTEIGVQLKLAQPGEPILILGHRDGSRLELGGVSTEGGTRFQASSSFNVFTEFGVEAGKIVIKPDPEDSDGFLATLLPENGIAILFDLVIGFSTAQGVYFRGSGGLQIPLPVYIRIGPIEIIGALLAIRFEEGGVPVDLAATIRGDFSVLKVVLQDVGLTANFTFPEDRRGNLGAANLALDFKPPNGAGIVVMPDP